MQAMLPLLIDAALKCAVILLPAALATFAMRRTSAAARHLVWTTAVAAVLMLPLLSWLLPGLAVLPGELLARRGAEPVVPEVIVSDSPPPAMERTPSPLMATPYPQPGLPDWQTVGGGGPTIEQTVTSEPMMSAVTTEPTTSPATDPEPAMPWWQMWTPIIWLSGAVFAFIPCTLGWLSLWRLARTSERVTAGPWYALAQNLAAEVGLTRRVVVLRSNRRTMPMTWGVLPWRPAWVLIPADAAAWSTDRRRAVLLHELAHVKRRDCVTQMMTHLVCALYWFNPLVWFAAHRMLIERERACDDLVLLHNTKSSDYAQHLFDIATGPQAGLFAARAPGSPGIAMARRSKLEGRLLAILDQHRNRRAMTKRGIVMTLAVVSAMAVSVACVRTAKEDTADQSSVVGPTDGTELDLRLVARATAIAQNLEAGRFEAAREHFDSRMRQVLSVDQLRELWQQLSAAGGDFEDRGEPYHGRELGFDAIYVPLRWERNAIDLKVVFDREAKVTGLGTMPPKNVAFTPGDFAAQQMTRRIKHVREALWQIHVYANQHDRWPESMELIRPHLDDAHWLEDFEYRRPDTAPSETNLPQHRMLVETKPLLKGSRIIGFADARVEVVEQQEPQGTRARATDSIILTGEVPRPGNFMIPPDGELSLLQVLTAAGYTPADPARSLIQVVRRQDSGDETRLPGVRYEDLLSGNAENIALQAKDMVIVREDAAERPVTARQAAIAQQVDDATPEQVQVRVRELIYQLRYFHPFTRVEEWTSVIRELVEIGRPAVPELVEELRRTENDATIRALAFTLRAIGDARAVPALIDKLPQTAVWNSDLGVPLNNRELFEFMARHQDGERREPPYEHYFSFGRAVREIDAALGAITGHSVETDTSVSDNAPALRAEAADRWRQWWAEHSHRFVTPEQMRSLDQVARNGDAVRQAGEARYGPLFPTGQGVRLGNVRERVLEPYDRGDKPAFIYFPTDQVFEVYQGAAGTASDSMAWLYGSGVNAWVNKVGRSTDPGNEEQVEWRYHLEGANLHIWEVENARWDELEADIRDGRRVLEPTMAPEVRFVRSFRRDAPDWPVLPATFLFTTPHGHRGILQVLDDNVEQRAVRFRYRMFEGKGLPDATPLRLRDQPDPRFSTLGEIRQAKLFNFNSPHASLINFQTGETVALPAELRGEDRYPARMHWLRQHPELTIVGRALLFDDQLIDAGLNLIPAGLNVINGRVVEVAPEVWDQVEDNRADDMLHPHRWNVDRITATLSRYPPLPAIEMPVAFPGTTPRSFLFSTAAGVTGILQIANHRFGQGEPPAVEFRYRIIHPLRERG